MKRRFFTKAGVVALGAVAMATQMNWSSTAGAADFSGQRIEWIIPFQEGGGSDLWSRFFAPLLSEQLPGKPTVIVRNVPGGGSTKGANQFAARAKPDGLTILGTSGSTQFPYLLGDKRVNYEYKDWHVVMATALGGVAFVSGDLGVTSAKDIGKLKGKDLKFGANGPTGLGLVALLAFEKLGLDVKPVFGMKGRGAARLAFERGETNIGFKTSQASRSKVVDLVKSGKAVPLMSWGAFDSNGKIVRDPSTPDLPSFPEVYEMVHGQPPSGAWWNAWKAFFTAGFAAQKMVFLPKDTPQDIIDTWREAAAKTIAAPGFAASAEKVFGPNPHVVGAEAIALKATGTEVDPEAAEWLTEWLTSRFNVKL